MYKISISKELFENIFLKKEKSIEKPATKYWKKELLSPKIIDDTIFYDLIKIDKIKLINGLEKNSPQMVLECLKLDYKKDKNIFVFHLGKILEQKNIDNIDDEKDLIIKQLLDEKEELKRVLLELKMMKK
ncbi:hypothetical protein [Arcobacter porcinus]|uniref:Uncharacterized protein n=1 Tax=Arcobacter porcinus TaxID=1935204 RepID=A0A5C2HC55_9BACT|nr:hypothetical protein [Arcobacter porcinus]OCL92336.1 hypothetical protein AAX27_01114 [Aliarcobacter thereius]QEP40467.1 hypothetical protein APORC_0864 [Arcobacter porcinus]